MRHSSARRCSVWPVPWRDLPRRGVALLLVLVIISIGSILAMRYLRIASMRSTMSQSFLDAKKAELLGESGIAEAAYWFRHPELTGWSLWSGVASRKPESTVADYYKVTVAQQTGSNPPRYTVTSEGHILAGTVDAMVRTVKADFGTCYGFPDAITAADDLYIPSSVTTIGSVFADGWLDQRGTVDGNVWAVGTVFNYGTINGRTYAGTSPRFLGVYPVIEPITYICRSTLYTVPMIAADSNTSKTWSSSGTNPMGVWYRRGNLHLYGTTTVDGTLVVSGNLHLCAGSTTVINPRPGFPAIVVKGDLNLENDRYNADINGTVLVGNRMQTMGTSMPNSRLAIKGALVFTGSGGFPYGFSSNPTILITHDPMRTDVSELFPSQPRWTAGIVQTGYRADEP